MTSGTQVKVIGGFIVLSNGQAALNARHITRISVTGREEDPVVSGMRGRKDVELTAEMEPEGGTAFYALGRFATFNEATAALAGLLKLIDADRNPAVLMEMNAP